MKVWGRFIFPAEKAFAPPQKHQGLNIHQESNLAPLAPLGSQAGGLTTRPDLYGLGDGTILAYFDKIIQLLTLVSATVLVSGGQENSFGRLGNQFEGLSGAFWR